MIIAAHRDTLTSPLRCEWTPLSYFQTLVQECIDAGGRLGVLSVRREPDGTPQAYRLMALLLQPDAGTAQLLETTLPWNAASYPSLTPVVPQAHWFERAIHDFFGISPQGHPHPKSLLLHEAWPDGYLPQREPEPPSLDREAPRRSYEFLQVEGEGVYEVPVGPIHAGIIEPGHFRFSCLGEVIHNLEIRLGCVHRGVEQTLTRVPWQKARFVAEAASSDTAVGNALAHALAIEQILGIQAPPRAQWLRGIALEIERAASHIGDLAGISGDIGFSGPAGIFAHLRGAALGLQERLTGSRLGTAYVTPGGVVRPLSSTDIQEVKGCVEWLAAEIGSAVPLLMDNSGAIERMESTGRVRHAVARSFGLVGPAGRASGLDYDVRQSFPLAPYTSTEWMVASGTTGDVLARAQVRVHEIAVSLQLLKSFLDNMPEGPHQATTLPSNLPALCVGVGIVEAWRGELIHLAFTGEDGRISRYCIKDPSFNNWTGLSVAVRGEVLADFPLCNKSFGLSYSGNDL